MVTEESNSIAFI